ncbi:hypothetical protein T440DRAFT_545692 [Plenodomus tracheiphilus IPT5]|uniref:Uncharacterized protein n=1 Tax=Plenodomus tracheiphilus IPT5 TaxID=1408161 RepID=A0A6A7ASG8_9PLEO|nr:hypothetical protein T440DRAFT_545692 [Plenodomus tracheiphilus IPT5]
MSSYMADEEEDFGRSQLMTPPPTPNKRRGSNMPQAMRFSPSEQQRDTNDAKLPKPATKCSMVKSTRTQAHKREGKLLRKADKIRQKNRAAKAERRNARHPIQVTKSSQHIRPVTPPPKELRQKGRSLGSWKPLQVVLKEYAPFYEPSMEAGSEESLEEEEEADELAESQAQSDDAMRGYDVIETSDSGVYTPTNSFAAANSLSRFEDDHATLVIEKRHSDATPSPPSTPSDPAALTTAFNLLVALQDEQSSFNARSNKIEAQIARLMRTPFKLDYATITKLEEELALMTAFSFDMFIEEWAFRDLLEVNGEDDRFELAEALGKLAVDVEALVGEYASAIEGTEI